jgi:hypothetical protein
MEAVMLGHRFARALLGVAIATLLTTGVATAGTSGGGEAAWFDGQLVTFRIPAGESSDPNQFIFACFSVGPDLSNTNRSAPAPIMYVVVNDYATGHHCPGDPTLLRHDHVLTTAPGLPGYTASWTIILALPGPNFDPLAMPYTSAAAVTQGVSAGQLVLVDAGFRTVAPVAGG